MKVLILGLGKSGTTALLYKIAGGLPDCRAFQGGTPGKIAPHCANGVFKFTYNEDKGRSLELFGKHVSEVSAMTAKSGLPAILGTTRSAAYCSGGTEAPRGRKNSTGHV